MRMCSENGHACDCKQMPEFTTSKKLLIHTNVLCF